MFNTYFAHSGETHTETSESVSHWLSSTSNALLLWLILSVLIIFVLPQIFKKVSRANLMLVFSAFNLFYGVFLYNKAPEVGAIALSVGFAATLLSVITGLKIDEPKKKGRHGKRK